MTQQHKCQLGSHDWDTSERTPSGQRTVWGSTYRYTCRECGTQEIGRVGSGGKGARWEQTEWRFRDGQWVRGEKQNG